MSDREKEKFLNSLDAVYCRAERFALSITCNRDLAKDLLGDAMLIVCENFDKIEDKQALLSYTFTIISRLYKQHYYKSKRFVHIEKQDLEELYSYNSSQEIETDVKILFEAMEKLPFQQKEALLLQMIHGFSQKDIAKIQNSTVTAVKVRVYRAKQNLRKILGVKQ